MIPPGDPPPGIPPRGSPTGMPPWGTTRSFKEMAQEGRPKGSQWGSRHFFWGSPQEILQGREDPHPSGGDPPWGDQRGGSPGGLPWRITPLGGSHDALGGSPGGIPWGIPLGDSLRGSQG
jgi:hypothetical protein